MYQYGRHLSIIGLSTIVLYACIRPIPPQESLYKRLGGEKTLVAISLQVSRKPEIRKALSPNTGRIFRQRLSDWLCHASAGPCEFPSGKEFFDEVGMNPAQHKQLIQALRQVLSETGIPKSEREELTQRLSSPIS